MGRTSRSTTGINPGCSTGSGGDRGLVERAMLSASAAYYNFPAVTSISSNMHWTLLVFLGVSISLASCALPRVPKGWEARQIVVQELDDSGPSRLQLLFCYGPITSHCLVRIVGPSDELTMWDPGGIYGFHSPMVARVDDVIHGQVPSLKAFWSYRLTMRERSEMMGVFEWEIPDDEARHLRRPLVTGDDLNNPFHRFQTDVPAMTCGLALSDYLIRYAGPRLMVPIRWIQPADTASYLWSHHPPDRVIMFNRQSGVQPMVYEPIRSMGYTAESSRLDGPMDLTSRDHCP